MSVVAEAPRVSPPATVKASATVIALAVLAGIAPLDLAVPPNGWTSIYIRPLMATVIVVSLWVIVDRRASIHRRLTLLHPAVGLFLAVVWISAAVSDAPITGAAGAIRLTAFGLLVIATHAAVNSPAEARLVFKGLVTGLLAASVIGLIVLLAGHEVLGTEHLVGRINGQSRLTRPWSHPNVAGMAIVASVPAFWLFGRAWRIAAVGVVIPVLVLTCSRGAVVGVIAGALIIVAIRQNRTDVRRLAGIAAVALVVALVAPCWSGRFGGSSQPERLDAGIEAPASVRLEPAGATVQVDVTNRSTVAWPPDRVELSARWVGAGQGVIWGEHRWPLPTELSPGESVRMEIVMDASIPDGTFDVRWDLIEHIGVRARRSDGQTVISRGVVVGSAIDPIEIEPTRLWLGGSALDRREIWELAAKEFLDSPLLGVGPSELGLAVADEVGPNRNFGGRHAHSIVLEPLATTGVLGTIPLFVILVGGLRRAARRARRDRVALVVSVGLTATLVHGLFDWQLVYSSAAIPIALLTGVAWTLPEATRSAQAFSE